MRARRPTYTLPELQIDWAESASGETLGGPVFVCRPGGCARFRRSCEGWYPKTGGGPIQHCRLRSARSATLRRFMDFLKYEYQERT